MRRMNKLSQNKAFCFILGYPKAYNGTSKGTLRKEVVPFGFCNQPKRFNCRYKSIYTEDYIMSNIIEDLFYGNLSHKSSPQK